MTERWQNFFKNENNKFDSLLSMAAHHWNYHNPLYYRIKNILKKPSRILDVGCGLGLSAVYLSAQGHTVTAIDNDKEILKNAQNNAQYFQSEVKFEQADAHDLSKYYNGFDLSFSNGVLEHFKRGETITLLKEQVKCAEFVICIVPTKFTKYAGEITDERIYSSRQLAGLFRSAGMDVVESFGYGDIFAPAHIWIKRILPYGLYRILQDKFTYAMETACAGKKKL
jgi:SAM-dependent methyltransferase